MMLELLTGSREKPICIIRFRMTVSALVFFAFTLLNFAFPTNGLVYRTKDAIIIEDSNLYQPMKPFLMVKDMNNLYGAIPVHPLTGLMNGHPSVYPWLLNNNKSQSTGGNGKPTDSKQTAVTCGAFPHQTGLNFGEPGVVGGVAEKNAWPGIVVLKFFLNAFFCLGSLIAPDQVLTSADCVDMLTDQLLPVVTVHLGMHTLRPSDAEEARTVRRVTIHGGWNPSTNANNIAIITLSSPVNYTSTISPVCLAPEILVFAQFDGGVAVGWGLSKEKDSKSNVMHQTPMKILYHNKCKANYANNAEYMMCAAGPATDICHSDGGGPLLVQLSPGSSWTQIGIVNYGDGCSGPNYLEVFTRIMQYRRWIKEHANV